MRKDLQLIQPAAVSLTINRRLVSGDVKISWRPVFSWISLIVAWRWYRSALCAWSSGALIGGKTAPPALSP